MLTKKSKTMFVAAQYIDENGFILMSDGGVDCDVNSELTISEVIEDVTITLDEADEERITLDGDIDISQILQQLKQSLKQLVNLKNKVIPLNLEDFDLTVTDDKVKNTLEDDLPTDWFLQKLKMVRNELIDFKNQKVAVVKNPFAWDSPVVEISKKISDIEQLYSVYEVLLDYEDFYCNLTELSPISDYFEAYWYFVVFEKKEIDLTPPWFPISGMPESEVFNYLDTRFSVKHLKEGSTKRDYFYQLYLKVKPYLAPYFSLEKTRLQNNFVNEI